MRNRLKRHGEGTWKTKTNYWKIFTEPAKGGVGGYLRCRRGGQCVTHLLQVHLPSGVKILVHSVLDTTEKKPFGMFVKKPRTPARYKNWYDRICPRLLYSAFDVIHTSSDDLRTVHLTRPNTAKLV